MSLHTSEYLPSRGEIESKSSFFITTFISKMILYHNNNKLRIVQNYTNLINNNIERGHSNHENNNIIATELVNGGYSDADISFVFKSIYNEPAGDWGWYKDNPREAGRHITLIRQKALNRYSKDKLIQAGVCEGNDCSC